MEQPNLDYILKLSGDDEAIQLKLISILQYELPLEIDAYFACMHLKKTKQAASCVHKLKHKIGILGLEESYYTAEKYEDELKKNKKNLQKKFENTLTLMQNFVNEL
ncbi:Hpt domain-containing protein [Flavobacterium sp.]|uniref:Hpt domain-containing protein n=1 Tax=Flavobacterium sp. TaxID=239 RepID=UPI00248A385E|nr:Hpt domain-containing protein [Flavobacterium sp.]MDI1315953.1 Hpt domain-containing protein [Flavobacterium sp.]